MCPYYKEKSNFQFCEALADKSEFFGLRRVGDGSHTSEEDKLCARPLLFSLGKRNFWCAHWKTDCIMEQVMWIAQSLWEIREQFLFCSWWLSEILFTNPNRNKTSGGQNCFLYVCIMGSLKTTALIPADQFNYFNMFCLYYVYIWCSLLTSAS